VAQLEARLIELEGPEAHARWGVRLGEVTARPTPEDLRLGKGHATEAHLMPTETGQGWTA
jgi:hypothetical protein